MGSLDGRHSTKSKEECGERVKAEAKKMTRNTQYTQEHLAPVEDVPFVLSHDGLRHQTCEQLWESAKSPCLHISLLLPSEFRVYSRDHIHPLKPSRVPPPDASNSRVFSQHICAFVLFCVQLPIKSRGNLHGLTSVNHFSPLGYCLCALASPCPCFSDSCHNVLIISQLSPFFQTCP